MIFNANKKLVVLILFISLYSNVIGQDYIPYYLKVNEATRFIKLNKDLINKHQKADSIYNIAFSMVEYVQPSHYLQAAMNACKMDSLEKSKRYLCLSILKGMPIGEVKARKKYGLKPLIKSKYWKEYKAEYKTKRKIYEDSLDEELRVLIYSMYEKDQKYRKLSTKKFVKNIAKQKHLDSLNLVEIKKMQIQYGKIPGLKELGHEGLMNLYIVFRHVNASYAIDTLGPQLIKQSKYGDFPPEMGPGIIDYSLINQVTDKNKGMTRQKYGTQHLRTPKTNTLVIIPVQNIKAVNKLRREIGMYPLNEIKLSYDEDLVKKECKYFEF